MNDKKTREYDMSTRSQAAARTRRHIMKAAVDLWRKQPLHDFTLEAVAERAEVSVRTILRKFGSKEGLFEACLKDDAADIIADRNRVRVGDVENALRVLMEDYEKNGNANIRTLAMEEEYPVFHKMLEAGRSYHRAWCARVFAPFLPDPSDSDYETRLHAFYAATEVYLWKLLRKDLHRSVEDTRRIFRMLVYGLIETHKP